MSREPARMNVILDAIVARLKTIDGDPASWLTAPKTVKRWSPSPFEEAMPLLLVRCARWGPNEPQTGLQHNAEGEIEVEVFTAHRERADDPDRELHSVCADVISAIQNDWQLEDSGVPSLSIHVMAGYEPQRAETVIAGHCRATIGFKVFWPWEAATP